MHHLGIDVHSYIWTLDMDGSNLVSHGTEWEGSDKCDGFPQDIVFVCISECMDRQSVCSFFMFDFYYIR